MDPPHGALHFLSVRALPIIILDFLRATVYVEVRAAAQIFSRAAGGGRAATEPNVRVPERGSVRRETSRKRLPDKSFFEGAAPRGLPTTRRGSGLPQLIRIAACVAET